jgi:hypothetical protein
MRAPFIIYGDFECILNKLDTPNNSTKSENYQHHIPCSVGLKLVAPSVPALNDSTVSLHTGKDCVEWMLNELISIEERCLIYLFDDQRLIMTARDTQIFQSATECSICRKPFKIQNGVMLDKVRDHDHITGNFRGAAHNRCNLQTRKQYKIPIFFHNFRGYDSHLIVQALNQFPTKEITIIGQGMEKYLMMGWGDHLVFKDSLQFMAASLETLTANLKKAGDSNFNLMREEFSNISEENFQLLLAKGVFPYDYFDSWERLSEPQLPPQAEFFNRLRNCAPADEDYHRAQKVWREFHCSSFQDYMELYMKCDVLQLACIFEAFRNVCLQHYGLDPAYYVSSPNLAWDSMLKMTDVELDLISDPEMFKMLDNGIRGGICMITKRHAVANNSELPVAHYNKNEPTSHIIYLDANNLYGWAMIQPMGEKNFRYLIFFFLNNITFNHFFS